MNNHKIHPPSPEVAATITRLIAELTQGVTTHRLAEIERDLTQTQSVAIDSYPERPDIKTFTYLRDVSPQWIYSFDSSCIYQEDPDRWTMATIIPLHIANPETSTYGEHS